MPKCDQLIQKYTKGPDNHMHPLYTYSSSAPPPPHNPQPPTPPPPDIHIHPPPLPTPTHTHTHSLSLSSPHSISPTPPTQTLIVSTTNVLFTSEIVVYLDKEHAHRRPAHIAVYQRTRHSYASTPPLPHPHTRTLSLSHPPTQSLKPLLLKHCFHHKCSIHFCLQWSTWIRNTSTGDQLIQQYTKGLHIHIPPHPPILTHTHTVSSPHPISPTPPTHTLIVSATTVLFTSEIAMYLDKEHIHRRPAHTAVFQRTRHSYAPPPPPTPSYIHTLTLSSSHPISPIAPTQTLIVSTTNVPSTSEIVVYLDKELAHRRPAHTAV